MLGLKNAPAVVASILLLAGSTVSGAAIQRESSIDKFAALSLRDGAPVTCPIPTVDGENPAADPDTPDPHLFIESVVGEDGTCAVQGAPNTIEGLRRSFEEPALPANESHVEKRGSSRTYNVCGTGIPPSTLTLPPYPGAAAVAAATGKGWIYAVNQDNCGDAGITVRTGRPMNPDFVVEHVFEAQSMKTYIEGMISGVLAGGAPLPGGAATVNGIFDRTGVFFQPWPSSVPAPGGFGATPADTAMGLLGHRAPRGGQADTNNLQVLQRDLNAYKALLNKRQNFVSQTTYNTLTAKQKMHTLGSIQDMFQYLQLDQVVQSYNTVYRGLNSFWAVFATVPGAQARYNYANAFDAVLKDDLNQQIVLAKQRYTAIVTDLTNYFNGPQSAQEDPTFKTNALATLAQLTPAVDTAIAYRVDAMTALT